MFCRGAHGIGQAVVFLDAYSRSGSRCGDDPIEIEDMQGPFNFCSPHPERNHTFAKALGKALGRPAFLKNACLCHRKGSWGNWEVSCWSVSDVFPQKLQHHGFEFRYPVLKNALENLLNE